MYPEGVIASWHAGMFFFWTHRIRRDVSRVRHCVLGRTRFPFRHIEYRTKGPVGCRKKANLYANYERQKKHANGVFHKEIEHSHFSLRRNDRVPEISR